VLSSIVGYLLIATGAALALLVLRAIEEGAATGDELLTRSWINYWSTFTAPGIFVSFLGAAAGAFVVSGLRSVLTTGVMISLSLIPSITIVGMAIANGNMALAMGGFARWALDVGLVLLMSAIVLGLKQKRIHRRRSLE
jgi:uncharacterized membrane protein